MLDDRRTGRKRGRGPKMPRDMVAVVAVEFVNIDLGASRGPVVEAVALRLEPKRAPDPRSFRARGRVVVLGRHLEIAVLLGEALAFGVHGRHAGTQPPLADLRDAEANSVVHQLEGPVRSQRRVFLEGAMARGEPHRSGTGSAVVFDNVHRLKVVMECPLVLAEVYLPAFLAEVPSELSKLLGFGG